MERKGFSLAETVVSIFLLTACVLLILNLFDRSLSHLKRSRQLSQAASLAEDTLARVRAWARDPDHFASDWAGVTGTSQRDGFQITVERMFPSQDVLTPNLPTEEQYAPSERRLLPATRVVVRCTVSWGQEQLQVTSSLCAPPRPVDPSSAVVVRRVGGATDPVPPEAPVEFEATFLDANGRPIPGVTFAWIVAPRDGNATIDRSASHRGGYRVVIRNRHGYNPFTDSWSVRPGQVSVKAEARFNGVKAVGESELIRLGG